MNPDLDTLRIIPWLPATALVMADLSKTGWLARSAVARARS